MYKENHKKGTSFQVNLDLLRNRMFQYYTRVKFQFMNQKVVPLTGNFFGERNKNNSSNSHS